MTGASGRSNGVRAVEVLGMTMSRHGETIIDTLAGVPLAQAPKGSRMGATHPTTDKELQWTRCEL
jgi:hypothetical protein